MKHHSIKRILSILMLLSITLITVLQVSASENSASSVYANKNMYDYNTDSIPGIELTNAVYNRDTYAFTIARFDQYGVPSVTEFQLHARIFCVYSSGNYPTSSADDQNTNTWRTLGVDDPYLNSGNAIYRTPLSDLVSLRAHNFYNNVFFDSEFFVGEDFYIS